MITPFSVGFITYGKRDTSDENAGYLMLFFIIRFSFPVFYAALTSLTRHATVSYPHVTDDKSLNFLTCPR